MTDAAPPAPAAGRRALRRQQTLDEILDIAVRIMREDGVAALTMSAVARGLAIKPPSLYKYYRSREAIYDELFARGQRANLRALTAGIATQEPGLAALDAGMRSAAQWAVDNPVIAQLLFWRPVPHFEPSAVAIAPARELVDRIREQLSHAVASGEVGAAATSDEAIDLLSALHFGILSQHLANDPTSHWADGRYTRLQPQVVQLFRSAYPAP
jgi:AcrR family transcriptional regulator